MTSFALVACASTTSTPAPTTATVSERLLNITKLTGNATAGKTVYETSSSPSCASCHKSDGTGSGADGLFPELAEPSKNDPVDELAGYILNGVAGKKAQMPKQSSLSDQQVADVVAYMKQAFGK